jgi:hypothetical protein
MIRASNKIRELRFARQRDKGSPPLPSDDQHEILLCSQNDDWKYR